MIIARRKSGTYAIVLPNVDGLLIDLDSPVVNIALPEMKASEAKLVKVSGNSESVNLNWKVVDSSIDNSSLSATGADDLVSESIGAHNVHTADEQWWFIHDNFESQSLSETNDEVIFPMRRANGNVDAKKIKGKLIKVLGQLDGVAPVTWSVTMTLYFGEALVSADRTAALEDE